MHMRCQLSNAIRKARNYKDILLRIFIFTRFFIAIFIVFFTENISAIQSVEVQITFDSAIL